MLQRICQVSEVVHPIGEIRRLTETLARQQVDQQFRWLIDRGKRGGCLATDCLDKFLRRRNNQRAVLDVVAPRDHATDTDHQQCE